MLLAENRRLSPSSRHDSVARPRYVADPVPDWCLEGTTMNCPFTQIVPIVAVALVSVSTRLRRAAQTPSPSLSGTSWQLVRIQSMDDKVATPTDRSKYTMTFGADGRVNMLRRLQSRKRHLDIRRGKPARVRTDGDDARDVPSGIAARSNRQGHAVRSVVCDQGRTSVSFVDGRRRHLRVRTDAQERRCRAGGAWRPGEDRGTSS